MFEHFSDQSMKVMALADREAAALKHDRVGTGEILLGLLLWAEQSTEKFQRNFAAFNLTSEKARSEVKRITGSGAGERASAYSFTPGAEVLLLLAYDEALNLCTRPGTEKVEPEHLLLALLRQNEGVACRILERLGVADFALMRASVLTGLGVNQEALLDARFEKVRRQGIRVEAEASDLAMLATAENLLAQTVKADIAATALPYSPYAIELFRLARESAAIHGHDVVGSGHLLLAVLSMHKGFLLRVMAQCGVERYQVDEELSNILGPGSGVHTELSGDMAWSASCSKLLNLAAVEAVDWHHAFVGVEHVLLVLLREHEGVAGRIMDDYIVDKGALRNKILADEQFGTVLY
ncbi:hypothetical protein BH11CYA1_BH11CYA1_20160 [soil metagenome]